MKQSIKKITQGAHIPTVPICPYISSLSAHCSLCLPLSSFQSFLVAHHSPLIAHCSLLIAHCSLLIAHCSLLIAHCSLLSLRPSPRFFHARFAQDAKPPSFFYLTRHSLPFTHCSSLIARCFFFFAPLRLCVRSFPCSPFSAHCSLSHSLLMPYLGFVWVFLLFRCKYHLDRRNH
jgi:hypothetical protein